MESEGLMSMDLRQSGQRVFIDREHFFYPRSLDAE